MLSLIVHGLPTGWTVVEAAGTNQDISAWTNGDAASPTNGLLFSRQVSGGIGASAYYTGAANNFSDFSGSVLMQLGAGNSTHNGGVLMRTTNTTGGTSVSGYFAGISRNFVTSVGWEYRVFISENPATYQSRGTELDSSVITLAGGTTNTFRLEFSAQGTSISATAFQWDPTPGQWENLGTASATDSTYSSGFFALRGGFGNSDGTATFGDLTVIPEPSSFALLLASGAFMLVALRRPRLRQSA